MSEGENKDLLAEVEVLRAKYESFQSAWPSLSRARPRRQLLSMLRRRRSVSSWRISAFPRTQRKSSPLAIS